MHPFTERTTAISHTAISKETEIRADYSAFFFGTAHSPFLFFFCPSGQPSSAAIDSEVIRGSTATAEMAEPTNNVFKNPRRSGLT